VSVREAVDSAAVAIGASGSSTPRLDAELLLADVLGMERERMLVERDLRVTGSAIRAFQDAVRRRAVGHEPVAYLLGRRGFRHLELRVDPRVLVPRPETELLVEVGLELPDGARVADVGTGSGAVALALKHERPDLAVTASDVSEDALTVAQDNARRLGLDVTLVHADGLPDGRFDAVLSNPPYVAAGARLPADVLREPHAALFGGPDGLDVIRPLVAAAGARDGLSLLALEVGEGQAAAVRALAEAAGFGETETRPDLAGIERVVVAWR
jgi:release factor glutamine methyltransferase